MGRAEQEGLEATGVDAARTAADAFFTHWRSLPKAAGPVPHLRSYLDSPLLACQPNVAIVDVLPGEGFRARLVGTGRVKLYERDLTNQDPSQMFSDEARPVVSRLAQMTVKHPCGNRCSQTIVTSLGRKHLSVTVALPLAVDNRDAGCFIHFQHLAQPLDFDETAVQVTRIEDYEWIDIGAGVPD